jgi:glycine/D-amino acid oxidase-like deaminating enzyme
VPDQVIIIGAGVVGAATALALQTDGHEVILIDREAPCAGASSGNAGIIVNASCVPTAMPGVIFDVLRMLGQPHSPVSIRPAYFHKLLPWFVRFIWQSRASAATKNAVHLHALSKHAVAGWRRITRDSILASLLQESGWLKVYESEKTFAATSKARNLMDETGTKYELLSGAQICELEPKLAPIFNFGVYQRNCLRIVNPRRLIQAMVDLLHSRGGVYTQFGVEHIQLEDGKVRLSGPQGVLNSDKVVIAAGAWSRSLTRQLGDDVPLDTERGYHLMLPESTRGLLNSPVANGDSSFVLSPMESGLRMTSQVEFAGLTAAPDYAHVRGLLPVAKRMLPAIDAREESVWMGFRPSLPDSLPVLGFSSESNSVLYAFGHHHLVVHVVIWVTLSRSTIVFGKARSAGNGTRTATLSVT